MNIQGFLKWQFKGWYRALTFWGFTINVLAWVAMYGGCPDPWPLVMFAVSLVLLTTDLLRWYFRFSYSLYRLEQTQMMNELKRKERA